MRSREGGVFWRVGCVLAAATLGLAAIGYAVFGPQLLAARSLLDGRDAPVRSASVFEALRPAPSFEGEPPEPATPAARRVIETLERVESQTRDTRYQHRTDVDERVGRYHWDCSGMTGWALADGAPRARRAVGSGRPVARTFYRLIASAPTDRPRRGWLRVSNIAEVRPGDVFAWEKPPGMSSNNTGHVGFVVHGPVQLDDALWALRILDATSYPHQDDTRADTTGTGRGTMTFVTDAEGQAVAYGWHGTNSLGYIETPIVFGRVH